MHLSHLQITPADNIRSLLLIIATHPHFTRGPLWWLLVPQGQW